MIAVIFEVTLDPGKGERYFELAQALRKKLDQADGFISIERFQSLVTENKYVSLSFWRDEAAVKRWREHAPHRAAQRRGREDIFADYRIRVAQVVRDYGMTERAQAPG